MSEQVEQTKPRETKAWLRGEIDRLRGLFTKRAEPKFGSMRSDGDGITMTIEESAGITHQVIAALAQTLGEAVNYAAISGHHPAIGRIECIVQRVGKLSPDDARRLAERHLARAVALLSQNGIAWDGPTTFLPDGPIQRPVPIGKDRDWLTIDVSVQPNEMRCARCGSHQPMPEKSTAAMLEAMIKAFTKAHKGCKEGGVP